ncbi:MAG: CHAT domain-containing protein [Bacteroidota bacterium]|nr:CHAT domain-containing protein [Bacteroidota bacterium]
MSGKAFCLILPFLAIFSFKGRDPVEGSLKAISVEFAKADHLFYLPDATPATDSAALNGFQLIVRQATMPGKDPLADNIFFQSFYKAGVLLEVYGKFKEATRHYLHALAYATDEPRKLKMYVFAGGGYYNQNNFDSANYFLLKAEENADHGLQTDDQVRLYNTLGVLYYDNGNYLQSNSYFKRALNIIQKKKPADKVTALSVQLNMATCFYRLGLYDRALEIYQAALSYKLFLDEIYLNMGRAYAGLHRYPEALRAFRKVETKQLPRVLNEMARVALESGHSDSAMVWLNRFSTKKDNLKTNTLDAGINALYRGDLDLYRADPETAVMHFQEAIIFFSGNFKNPDIRTNPGGFTGTFAYYRLFDALYKKATAWEMLYKKTMRSQDLQSAFGTYQSTISLLTYIERSYEMDDAKILLKQKSEKLYKEALQVALDLNQLFPNGHYLEDAFLISERNKASVMASNLREQNFHFSSDKEADLIRQERNIKFNLARLSIKADQKNDAEISEDVNNEKSVYETQLAEVQKKLEKNNRYYQLKYQEDYPSVSAIQNSLNGNQVVISLSNSTDALQVFVITRSDFRHLRLDSGESIRKNVRDWIQILQSSENGKHPNTGNLEQTLYRQLIRPLEEVAGNKEDWIMVPDGIFFLLPFESLPGDASGTPLVEKHSLSYQFSSRFIPEKDKAAWTADVGHATLSFAPFATNGADLAKEGIGYLDRLPDSKKEISMLAGKQFCDSEATKENFLKSLNRFPIIHLATHAVADMNDPASSYIAFYPESGMRSDDCLFLGELYGLRMDSCQLVIISACETGKGQLISNEGVMSFARAFLYAGCPSTVNSLWKADDRSTSEILEQFHHYLEAGYSKSKALQLAKLDFIHKNPLYRNPAYWSHLILTGNPDALYKEKQPLGWAVVGICCCLTTFFVLKRKKESRRFS